jgi:oligoendopeptidase F
VVTKKTTTSPSVASLRRLPVLPHSEQLGKIHELQETEKFKGHRPLFTAEVIDMIKKYQKDNPKLNTKLSCSLAVANILQNGHMPTYNGNTGAVEPLRYGLVDYYKKTKNTDFEKRYTTLLNDRNIDYIVDEINLYLNEDTNHHPPVPSSNTLSHPQK